MTAVDVEETALDAELERLRQRRAQLQHTERMPIPAVETRGCPETPGGPTEPEAASTVDAEEASHGPDSIATDAPAATAPEMPEAVDGAPAAPPTRPNGNRLSRGLLTAYHVLMNLLTAQGRPLTAEERDALAAILEAVRHVERHELKRKERELRRKARRRVTGGEWG